jgi:NADH:ubiquinone oxidoreductase subunit 6 (subunit J)
MLLPLFAAASSSSGWFSGLTLLVGAMALYLLLPRPKPFPTLWGFLLGVLALALVGFLLVPTEVAVPETILFYVFSGIAIVAGVLLVTQRNPARAALSFALVVLSTCGLFLLLAAPFLMAATIIIYAGAIVVTFLFVLMLAQQEGLSNADARSREPLLSTFTAALLLFALLFVLERGTGTRDARKLLEDTRKTLANKDEPGMEKILVQYRDLAAANGWTDLKDRANNLWGNWSAGERNEQEVEALANQTEERLVSVGLLTPDNKLPLSALSGPPPNTPFNQIRRETKPPWHDKDTHLPAVPADNSAYLGRSLFTDYLLPVELGGTLLLVATIGAIAIGYRRPGSSPLEGRA